VTDSPAKPNRSEIVLYQTEDGHTRIQVRLEDETVWLTQKLMADLFQKDVRTINEHIQNIFEEGELSPESVIRKFRITAADWKFQGICRSTADSRSSPDSDLWREQLGEIERTPQPQLGSRPPSSRFRWVAARRA
jgi:hypothetical protein